MSRFFDLIDHNIVLKMPEVLLVKEFKILNTTARNRQGKWKKGDSEGKLRRRMYKELTFIYLMADWNSVYSQQTESQKWKSALEDCELLDSDIDDTIFNAIEKYRDLQKTKTMFLLEDAMTAVSKIRAYYKTVDLDERDENGRIINSAKDLITNLKNLSGVVESLKDLENTIQKELSIKSNIKADAKKGMFD